MFWVSFSAWVRACSGNQVDKFLKIVSKEHGKETDWYLNPEYQFVWHEQYSRVVRFYVEKTMEYTQKFMESPAGKVLENSVLHSWKRRSAKPLIDEGSLKSFEGAEGINWTMEDIFDFFSILTEVSSSTSFETSVSQTLISLTIVM